MQKILALESLRGLAALTVVLGHFAAAFYPAMVIGVPAAGGIHSRFDELILQSPLNIFISGDFAVYCFFVLSGFVLSFSFFLYSIDLVSATIKRYFRLAPMVLASVLFSYFLLKFGLYHNVELSQLTGSNWVAQFWRFPIDFLEAIWQGLLGTFLVQPNHTISLNPVLWTIYFEFIGSLLVFAFLALGGKDKRRWLLYILFILATISTYYSAFIIGVLLSDLYVQRNELFRKLGFMKRGYKIALIVIAIYLASYPAYTTDVGIVHSAVWLYDNNIQLTQSILYITASVIFIILLLTSHRVKTILEMKPFVFLGSISYSIYATHLSVLGTLAASLFITFQSFLPYNYAALVTFVIFVPSAIGVAYLFRRYIDVPSIELSKFVSNRMGSTKRNQPKKELIETML